MIREKLFKFFNSTKTLAKPFKFIFPVLIISFFVLASSFSIQKDTSKSVEGISTQARLTKKISISQAPSPQIHQGSMIISGEVTNKKIVPIPTATPTPAPALNSSDNSGLLSSINTFRSANGGIVPVSSSSTLCDIAGKRLNELIAIGTLDNHAGFNKYFQGQKEFNAMGEVLFMSSNSTSPDYAVNEGWAKSTDGHRENMLNPSWNYGCGATNSHIAVFDFGKK